MREFSEIESMFRQENFVFRVADLEA